MFVFFLFYVSYFFFFYLCLVRVGEGRACWSLGNAYVSLGDHKQALHYARKHLDISKEVRQSNSREHKL